MSLTESLHRFHARLGGDPLRDAFEGRSPVVPWRAYKPVPPGEIARVWEEICATPRTGKTVAYFHVPFCTNHCLFCNFYRNATQRNSSSDYVDAVTRELERETSTTLVRSGPVHAVYLGGGTPTDLAAPDLNRLLATIRRCLPLAEDCEITVEARATGFDPEKVAACLDAGANRFSFGVQTFDTEVRRLLGRKMAGEEIAEFLRGICALDRATVVCDLIFGLPKQTRESWRRDVALCADLGLDGVDLYCLTLLPGSPLANAIQKGSIPPGADLREQAVLYAAGVEALGQAGWRQLSGAHFARETRERNLYNHLVKSAAHCLAYGSGAGGSAPGYSYLLLPDLARYHEANARGEKPLAGLFRAGAGHAAKGRITGGMETGRLDLAVIDEAGVPEFTRSVLPLVSQWEEAGLLRRDGHVLWLTLPGRFWHTNLTAALHHAIDVLLAPPGQPAAAPTRPVMNTTRSDQKPPPEVLKALEAQKTPGAPVSPEALRARFAKNADGVLEQIAAQNGLSTREVVACLPEACCVTLEGARFAEIMEEISGWGEILLIVHTPDAVIECLGALPRGSFGRGFFNFEHGTPIRGHIRADHCTEICLVRRPFMGLETCSAQFFNQRGEAIFKIFVFRGEDGKLKAEQVDRFEALRERFRKTA